MPLKNKNNLPPLGWTFRQPELNWDNDVSQESFYAAVKRIISIRKANPRFNLSTDPDEVATELENYTVARLKSMPGGDKWLVPGDAPPFPARLRPKGGAGASGVAAAAEWVRNARAGVGLWLDYYGSKGPVEPSVAEQRASVCATCEFNQPMTGLNALSQEAGEDLSKILGTLRSRKLTTSKDEQLNGCALCACPLKAKVWVPMDLVLKHTRAQVMEKLPAHCWIKSEK